MNHTLLTDTLLTITDKMSLIVLTVSLWSGRKKLRADDLELTDGEIPPEELVSLGSKRICNPDALRVFSTLKGQAERACLKVGTRFLGGFLVPNDLLGALSAELDALKTDFEQEVQSFLSDYDREIGDWIDRHPDWERQLRAAVDPASKVGTKFSFRYRPLLIRPAPGQHQAWEDDVAEIGGTLFHEVAQIAVSLERSVVGKDAMTQRALGTFRRIQQKLAVLSFVDPRIQPILDPLEGFLARVPKTGLIAGALFQEGFGLWLLLCDEQRMANHGAGILAGETEEESEDIDAEIAAPPRLVDRRAVGAEAEVDAETIGEESAAFLMAFDAEVAHNAGPPADDAGPAEASLIPMIRVVGELAEVLEAEVEVEVEVDFFF
ncbi:DUF3150 domain-containing protein [Thiocystis violacea]|uniref:DUF3150 domain-containing protein n=1 Tax=Thiocystis violacea TaxID=13725 RepID=UPI001F5B07C8|nr:DUF3150 domain-containing protein [Thiocystis violacea]MBK1720113.1 hypothetical protein [Thiocystis violacea]